MHLNSDKVRGSGVLRLDIFSPGAQSHFQPQELEHFTLIRLRRDQDSGGSESESRQYNHMEGHKGDGRKGLGMGSNLRDRVSSLRRFGRTGVVVKGQKRCS